MRKRDAKVVVPVQTAPTLTERWLPTHATILLTGVGVSTVASRSWPVTVAAGLAFCALIVLAAGRWSARSGFGLANVLTSLRVLILLATSAWLSRLSDALLVGMLVASFLLDALDGAVARRLGTASEFGSTFDTEADAAFVLVLCVVLWLRIRLGLWVLIPGVLRYVYVLSLALFPSVQGRVRRPLFGRMAFLLSSALLLAAAAARGWAAVWLAGAGVAVSCVSFGRSFLQAYPSLAAYPSWRRFLHIGDLSWSSALRAASATLLFVLAWSLLNLTVNVRYPSPEPDGWYFLPSVDATVVVGVLALVGFF